MWFYMMKQKWLSHGRRKGGVEFEIEQEKVFFFVLSGKKRISPLLAPSGNILEKSLSAPPGKNPSAAHGLS